MSSPLAIFCPSLIGNWTSKPGTWNASSTLFEASTAPGKVREWVSPPTATTIVLTGRATSEGVESGREHPAAKQMIVNAIGQLRRKLLQPRFVAFMAAFVVRGRVNYAARHVPGLVVGQARLCLETTAMQ